MRSNRQKFILDGQWNTVRILLESVSWKHASNTNNKTMKKKEKRLQFRCTSLIQFISSHILRLFSLISFLFHLRVTRWSLAYTNNGIKYNKSSASSVWRRSDESLDSKLLTILTLSVVHFVMAYFSEIRNHNNKNIRSILLTRLGNRNVHEPPICTDTFGGPSRIIVVYLHRRITLMCCACVYSLRLLLVFSARYPRFVGCYLNNRIAWNTHVVRIIGNVGAVALHTHEPKALLLLSIYCYCYLPLQKH